MEEFMTFAVPAAFFTAFGAMGFFALKKRSTRSALMLAGVILGFTLWMLLAMSGAVGWDGLVYAIGLLFVAAPAGVGAILGGIAGWVKQNNDQQKRIA